MAVHQGPQRRSEEPERLMESPRAASTVKEETVEPTENLEQLKAKQKKQVYGKMLCKSGLTKLKGKMARHRLGTMVNLCRRSIWEQYGRMGFSRQRIRHHH